MTCDISYSDAREMLQTYNDSEDDTGEVLEHSYLFQFDESILTEEEAPIIIKDLTESYIKAFGKDTLDEEDQ